MRLYKDTHDKNWAITLENTTIPGEVDLNAVDANTGNWIATIATFGSTGTVRILSGVAQALEKEGYSPYEHNNEFTDEGQLLMRSYATS